MTFSIIQKSKLKGALRIDAEYYQQEYLEKIERLKSFPTVKLSDIAYITDGEHGSPIWDENSGINYYSAQNVRDCLIDKSGSKTISKLIDIKNKRSRLQPGDVLISTVGTIGFSGLVTEEILPANIDRHVSRIVLKKDTIDPEFLVAFLNSIYGKFQSTRESTGNVQLNLFIDKIREILVPKYNNRIITNVFKTALNKISESDTCYTQAEDLLLSELGLRDFKFENDFFYEINISEINERIDADYYQPKYEQLIKKLKLFKTNRLEDHISSYSTGFTFKSDNYKEEGIPLIRINNIKKGLIDLSDTAYLSEKDFSLSPKDIAKSGDIVLSMSGSIGLTAIIPQEIPRCSVNQRILKFTSKNINKEYFVLVLNSTIGKSQLDRIGTGGVQTNISYSDIKNIIIPDLDEDIQQKISELVKKSHEARKKSRELLQEAKRKVEEMIEEGGES